MKKLNKILAAVLLIAMALSLCACGAKMEGKYMIYSMEAEGVTIDLATLKTLSMNSSYIEFKDKDTAVISMAGEESEELTYDAKEQKLIGENDEEISYTLDGDKLSFTIEGSTLVFVKEGSELLK